MKAMRATRKASPSHKCRVLEDIHRQGQFILRQSQRPQAQSGKGNGKNTAPATAWPISSGVLTTKMIRDLRREVVSFAGARFESHPNRADSSSLLPDKSVITSMSPTRHFCMAAIIWGAPSLDKGKDLQCGIFRDTERKRHNHYELCSIFVRPKQRHHSASRNRLFTKMSGEQEIVAAVVPAYHLLQILPKRSVELWTVGRTDWA